MVFLVSSWWNFAWHIIIRMSLYIGFHLDNDEINPCNTWITTAVWNIYWSSFKFNQLFFVFLTSRTTCTSKLKHLMVSVMGFERKKCKINGFTSHFNQELQTPNICTGKFIQNYTHGIIRHWVFLNVEFWCTEKHVKNTLIVIW